MADNVIQFPKPKREPARSAKVERLVAVLERELLSDKSEFRRLMEAKISKKRDETNV